MVKATKMLSPSENVTGRFTIYRLWLHQGPLLKNVNSLISHILLYLWYLYPSTLNTFTVPHKSYSLALKQPLWN